MKAVYVDISNKNGIQSFVAYDLNVPRFEFNWHYHPEYELTLITKGKGKRLVGDSHENFEAGDLVLLGPELPHTWVSEQNKSQSAGRQGKAIAVVIQFSEKFIEGFLQPAECAGIKKLLAQARVGVHFQKRKIELVNELIAQLPGKAGVEKIAALLNILNGLAQKKYKLLASPFFLRVKGKTNEKRINTVCQYIQKHAGEKISITKAASLIHLSDSAFCKFFKRGIGKTFSDYVNTIRIGNACHLLTETDKTIAEIAFASGFESLTYFNRIFLKKKKLRPAEFRNNF